MNIDTLLYNETMGLLNDTQLSVGKFLRIAGQEDLRQQDWDRFWKGLREKQFENSKFDICLNGKDMRVTLQELQLIVFSLGDGEKVSDCCGDIVGKDGICSYCGEPAKEVLNFDND